MKLYRPSLVHPPVTDRFPPMSASASPVLQRASALGVVPAAAPTPPSAGIRVGTPEFRRLRRAMFLGGFATFSLLYCVQPLLPLFSHDWQVSPAQASTVLSAATGGLALTLVVASAISDRIGRRGLMVGAVLLAALLGLACAAAAGLPQLVWLRALEGIALAGLPAVAMAYLSEEMEPRGLATAMGLYIAGSAFGGMSGRIATAWLAELWDWRAAMAAQALLALAIGLVFWKSLPPSRAFRPRPLRAAALAAGVRLHLADAGLPWLYALAFLLMGCFVSLYNYLGYRLAGAPFGLGAGWIGTLSVFYVSGMLGSGWTGRLAERYGLRRVLWVMTALMLAGLLATLADALPVLLAGVALATFGFFGAHATASAWVGRRAREARGLASALYLCAYYAGSSLLGSVSGLVWHVDGWNAVVVLLATLLLACLGIALRLRSVPPLAGVAAP